MTQGGKEVMAGRWQGQGMLGKIDVRVFETLDQSYLEIS
jgi:hypothetical protein